MLPGIDGFELLRALRAAPATRDVPVILLSARAGDESRIAGLEAGADDYLTKPFSARELLARVDAHVRLAALRRDSQRALRDSEERYRRLAGLMPVAVYTCEAPSGVITFYNQQAARLWGRAPQPGYTDERFSGRSASGAPTARSCLTIRRRWRWPFAKAARSATRTSSSSARTARESACW